MCDPLDRYSADFVPTSTEEDDELRGLLIIDGYSSRNNLNTLKMLRDANIEMIFIPAHMSHLVQPLDLCPFKELKQIFHGWQWSPSWPKVLRHLCDGLQGTLLRYHILAGWEWLLIFSNRFLSWLDHDHGAKLPAPVTRRRLFALEGGKSATTADII